MKLYNIKVVKPTELLKAKKSNEAIDKEADRKQEKEAEKVFDDEDEEEDDEDSEEEYGKSQARHRLVLGK